MCIELTDANLHPEPVFSSVINEIIGRAYLHHGCVLNDEVDYISIDYWEGQQGKD
ncbi:hypothetical protein D3C84_499830 [compost metagenome]|jgi:hypothetical protein